MRRRDRTKVIVGVLVAFLLYLITRRTPVPETDPPQSTGALEPGGIWVPWTVDEEGMHVHVTYDSPPLMVGSELPYAFWPNSYNRGKYKGDPTRTVINRTSWHRAVDIRALRSTPVLAVRKSLVLDAGKSERGGYYVRLLDVSVEPTGMEFYYAHLDVPPIVELGDCVEAGGIIGQVGNTGNAVHTKCHLHFQQKLHKGRRGYARFPNPYGALLETFGSNRRWPKSTPPCTKKRATCTACLEG